MRLRRCWGAGVSIQLRRLREEESTDMLLVKLIALVGKALKKL